MQRLTQQIMAPSVQEDLCFIYHIIVQFSCEQRASLASPVSQSVICTGPGNQFGNP